MKMPALRDLRKTKEELILALAELDNLEEATRHMELNEQNGATSKHHGDSHAEENLLKEKVEFLEEANKELTGKNEGLVGQLETVKTEKGSLEDSLAAIGVTSQKLKNDVGKINEEKSLLASIVRNTQDENQVLSKMMEKITSDYEELKKAFETQKCPKDDKIKALRNTSKALETENELLLEEKNKIVRNNANTRKILEEKISMIEKESEMGKEQLMAYRKEKKHAMDQYESLENEKLKLTQKLSQVENELASVKAQANKVNLGEVITLFGIFLFTILIVCFYK